MSDMPSEVTTSFSHTYGNSSAYSIGIEEEFQLVDAETYALVPRIDAVMANATEVDRKCIKQELLQSVLEVATPICTDTAQARRELEALRQRVHELALSSGCRFASAGTHPFSRYELQMITDSQRYRDLVNRFQWIAQRELIFGLHVHVGLASPQQAIYVFNHIRAFLPEFLALSANSPYWQGRDTGLQSSRSKVFDAFPRSGIPRAFTSWDEWESLMRRAMSAGTMDDYTYVWWDVRPHPKFGTVEVRICDAQTDINDTLAIAALIQATAAWLGDLHDEGWDRVVHPEFLIAENKFSAARHGIHGSMINLDTDTSIPTVEAIQRLMDTARPYAKSLGSETEFEHLNSMLTATGADRQRAAYESDNRLSDVEAMLVNASWNNTTHESATV